MTDLLESRTLNVSIACPPERVYEFVRDASNLPRWSFFRSVARDADGWILGTAEGPVRLRYVERNPHGVLDHRVTLGSGVEVYVPMRVIANGGGSEVLFTLFRGLDTTDEAFAADARQVEADLALLAEVLEGSAPDAPA